MEKLNPADKRPHFFFVPFVCFALGLSKKLYISLQDHRILEAGDFNLAETHEEPQLPAVEFSNPDAYVEDVLMMTTHHEAP